MPERSGERAEELAGSPFPLAGLAREVKEGRPTASGGGGGDAGGCGLRGFSQKVTCSLRCSPVEGFLSPVEF